VRLTTRRLEALNPLSIAEIQADKDLLRAEFAMSTYRVEKRVEEIKGKATDHLARLTLLLVFLFFSWAPGLLGNTA